jgi:hypothetical protein
MAWHYQSSSPMYEDLFSRYKSNHIVYGFLTPYIQQKSKCLQRQHVDLSDLKKYTHSLWNRAHWNFNDIEDVKYNIWTFWQICDMWTKQWFNLVQIYLHVLALIKCSPHAQFAHISQMLPRSPNLSTCANIYPTILFCLHNQIYSYFYAQNFAHICLHLNKFANIGSFSKFPYFYSHSN